MFETIVIDGPGKNSLGSAMMDSLLSRIAAADGKPILLTGAGDAFSAGLDLKEVASLDAAGMETFLSRLERLMVDLFLHPAPTVALVNGHAIAGGAILTICCDHRVAARNPKAKIGLNEVALGLRFPPQVLAIARYRVREAETVLLGAGLHDPETAARLGLVDEVADDARAVAEARLKALASHPAAAYAVTKKTLREEVVGDPEKNRAFLREAIPAWVSPELKERIRAVLAR